MQGWNQCCFSTKFMLLVQFFESGTNFGLVWFIVLEYKHLIQIFLVLVIIVMIILTVHSTKLIIGGVDHWDEGMGATSVIYSDSTYVCSSQDTRQNMLGHMYISRSMHCQIVTRAACKASLPKVLAGNVGNTEIFCAFTMAWKHFHYISRGFRFNTHIQ